MIFIALTIFFALAEGNVYLHSPRGSNNRLNENSAQNSNEERLFLANNNRRGGYNVGDKTDQASSDESSQYSMQYFQSGDEGSSYLTIEWTNLMGCGFDEDGDKINTCEIVLQTNCQSDQVDGVPPADSFTIRNGKNTNQMPYVKDPGNVYDPQGRCFIDGSSRDLAHRKSNIPSNAENSIQFCLDQCKTSGYIYAGIQYERECWCDNDFGKYGEAPFSDCYLDCADESGNKCGAGYRNNVYLSSSNASGAILKTTVEIIQNEADKDIKNKDDDYEIPLEQAQQPEDPYKFLHLTSKIESSPDEDSGGVPEQIDFFPEIENDDEGCTGILSGLIGRFLRSTKPNERKRRVVALGTQAEKNVRRSTSTNQDIGLHEPWEYYDRCDPSIGKRYGMECLTEREQWPDPSISPWVDVAYFSDDSENMCTNDVETTNQRHFFECVEYYDEEKTTRKHSSSYFSQSNCEANGGDWLGFYKVGDIRDDIETQSACLQLNGGAKTYVWGRPISWKDLAADVLSSETCIALPPKTECLQVPNTRDGYLGNADGENSTPSFEWKLPNYEEDKRCVFRIRYMVSADSDQTDISQSDNVFYADGTDGVALAVTKTKAVFEDRSHIFKLLQRPEGISDDLTIHNLVVRGKRGNIVQTFPAVEYDFAPNRLSIPQGDAIHVQWTGSNTHNNGNPGGDGQTGDAGEGRGGTDRHNFIQLLNRKANLVAPDHKHSLFQNAEWIWSSHEMGNPENKDFNIALSMATSGYYQCKEAEECNAPFDNSLNDQLNNAPASYHGNIFVPSAGEHHYKCMRNNNFSNRSQKGTILVE